jgi:hypothetical protein
MLVYYVGNLSIFTKKARDIVSQASFLCHFPHRKHPVYAFEGFSKNLGFQAYTVLTNSSTKCRAVPIALSLDE